MKTYKEFINEGLIDKMAPKSEEEILNSLEKLSNSDKIITIIKNKLPYELLPDNLTIESSLECSYNQLTKLPDNLTVNGYLDCSYNQLTKLPDNLTVNGYLDCRKNTLKLELPTSAKIRGDFYN